jgi:spore maturation protein CgeB
MNTVILGLSITSSWGNGHATTYRALARQLAARGHSVTFLERDAPWYAQNRDLPSPAFAATHVYGSVAELRRRHANLIGKADLVIVGSYVPDGIAIGEWVTSHATGVTAFYDIDTPVTLAALRNGGSSYISKGLIPRYDLYLSFTGGPTLQRLEHEFGARMARPLYCSVDIDSYFPEPREPHWDIGYLGTYSDDRQPTLTELMLTPARRFGGCRFVVAGAQYPPTVCWPENVRRIAHLPPHQHRAFYNAQRYTLNVTRRDMIRAGWSPSVRLFEAAACGTPIITDYWDGLEEFFEPGRDILVARRSGDVASYLHDLTEDDRVAIGARARRRVLARHTAGHRVEELEAYTADVAGTSLAG